MARRMFEAFLAFRQPQISGDLWQKLTAVPFDEAKKLRILRFLHTHSHSIAVGEPEHDLTALAEGPAVFKDLLEMIESLDGAHFSAMVLLNAPSAEYAIEVQLDVKRLPINEERLNAHYSLPRLGPGSTVFPRYALGDPTDVGQLLKSFHHDFWNRLGQDVGDEDGNFVIENWPGQDTGEKD